MIDQEKREDLIKLIRLHFPQQQALKLIELRERVLNGEFPENGDLQPA